MTLTIEWSVDKRIGGLIPEARNIIAGGGKRDHIIRPKSMLTG